MEVRVSKKNILKFYHIHITYFSHKHIKALAYGKRITCKKMKNKHKKNKIKTQDPTHIMHEKQISGNVAKEKVLPNIIQLST